MRKLFDKLLLLVVCGAILSTIGPIAHWYDDYLQNYWLEKSLHHTIILDIKAPDGSGYGMGSGVILKSLPLVDAAGCSLLVVTAYHNTYRVLDQPGTIDIPLDVELMNGTEGLLLSWDVANDLALLWFEDSNVKDCENWSAADLATRAPPLGGNVWATGFPSRVRHLVRGTYAGPETLRFTDTSDRRAQYVFSSGPGMSGGGIWYKGRLVSIIQSKANPDTITSAVWGAPTNTLRSFLDDETL